MTTKSSLLLAAATLSLAACGGADGNRIENRVDEAAAGSPAGNQAAADPGAALNPAEDPGTANQPANRREAPPPERAGAQAKASPAAEPPSQPQEPADPHAGHDMDNMSDD